MGSNGQYTLNWSSHSSHLKKAFDSLLTDNEFVDVTLSCEGKKITAHKMLLSACSAYFHYLFRDNPCQHPIVILKDVKFQNLVNILKFMYLGEVSVPAENFDEFLKTAKEFQINGLADDEACAIEKESDTNVTTETQMSETNSEKEINETARKRPHIVENNQNNEQKRLKEEVIYVETEFKKESEFLLEETDALDFDVPTPSESGDLLQPELQLVPKDWHNYLHMNEETYLHLLSLVAPLIKQKGTIMTTAISPHDRLTATLKFLATGRSYTDFKFSTIISPQALNIIIPETCDAIFKVLLKDYLKFPRTTENWKSVAAVFEQEWDFPHCLGVIDGKHISIVPPNGSGTEFYNHKGGHSMVLVAIVDANHQFLMCDFGTNGRISDSHALQNTKFFQKLQNKLLNIPSEDIVGSQNLPYVFVADNVFPLRQDMITPFRQPDLTSIEKKIYNYRISRVRRIIENTFGILASRFQIFHTQINLKPSNIDSVVMATCALHNFLMKSVPNDYSPPECFTYEDIDNGTVTSGFHTGTSSMENLDKKNPGYTTNAAKNVRESFTNYFIGEGQVPWQTNFIH